MRSDFTSEALRTIGHDLDLRGLKTFSIRCDDDVFVVDAGYQPPPAAMPVTLHYCRKDIEQLKRKAEERCDDLSITTNFIYLTETLSAIATYIQDKAGHLVSISNKSAVIETEYEAAQRRGCILERLTDADVYSLCIRSHKRRQKRQISNALRFTRFSSVA
jgi:hypothetical protein